MENEKNGKVSFSAKEKVSMFLEAELILLSEQIQIVLPQRKEAVEKLMEEIKGLKE